MRWMTFAPQPDESTEWFPEMPADSMLKIIVCAQSLGIAVRKPCVLRCFNLHSLLFYGSLIVYVVESYRELRKTRIRRTYLVPKYCTFALAILVSYFFPVWYWIILHFARRCPGTRVDRQDRFSVTVTNKSHISGMSRAVFGLSELQLHYSIRLQSVLCFVGGSLVPCHAVFSLSFVRSVSFHVLLKLSHLFHRISVLVFASVVFRLFRVLKFVWRTISV